MIPSTASPWTLGAFFADSNSSSTCKLALELRAL